MTNRQFKSGDVVQLRAGGCLMTVEEVLDSVEDTIKCVWFDDDGDLQHSRFTPLSLRHVTIED